MTTFKLHQLGLAALALAVSGCSGTFQFASRTADAERPGRACVQPGAGLRIRTLDWDESARQKLEERARAGAVVVRAEACGWHVLEGCSVEAKYAFRPQALRRERDNAGNEMGISVSSGPNVSSSSGALNDVAIAGSFDLGQVPTAADLQGNCGGATHVLARYSAGAFRIEGGHSKSAGVSLPYGTGANTHNWKQSAKQAGRVEACETRGATGDAPPVDCSALIDIDVVPLAATRPVAQAPAPAPKADACAQGDVAACDLQCRGGSAAACAALTSRCAAGFLPACMAAGSSSLERWFYAGR